MSYDWTPDGSLDFYVEPHATGLRVRAVGDLDIVNSARFESVIAALAGHGRQRLELDAAGIRCVDSVGLRSLVATGRRLGAQQGFSVINVPDSVERLLDLTGLGEDFAICRPDVALRRFAG